MEVFRRGSASTEPGRIGPWRGRTYPCAAEAVNRFRRSRRAFLPLLTASGTDRGLRDTLVRWATVNVADTRHDANLEGRVYAVPFATVWDAILADIDARPRWDLRHKDEELGLVTVECRTLVFRFTDDLTIWVTLDEHGLTRVEALSRSRVGRGDLGVNRRRILGWLDRLDEAVGPARRVKAGARRDAGGAAPADD